MHRDPGNGKGKLRNKYKYLLFHFCVVLAFPFFVVSLKAQANEWKVIGKLSGHGSFMHSYQIPEDEVVVFGGFTYNPTGLSTDIVNMRTEVITPGSSMKYRRRNFASAQVPSGKVYVFGGIYQGSPNDTKVEVFDPTSRTWQEAGKILLGRTQLSAIALSEKYILVVGGRTSEGVVVDFAEIFNTESGQSTAIESLPYESSLGQIIRGRDSSIYVFAGRSGGPGSYRSRYVYRLDMQKSKWVQSGTTDSTYFPTISTMDDGDIIWTGGSFNEGQLMDNFSKKVARFINGGFEEIGSIEYPRAGHCAQQIGKDLIVVTGGNNNKRAAYGSCEFVDRRTGVSREAPTLNFARAYHTSARCVVDGLYRVIVAGGESGTRSVPEVEILEQECTNKSAIVLQSSIYSTRGSAHISDTSIILTDTAQYQAGAAWLRGRIDVAGPFTMNFGFTLENGNDHDQPDGGPVGADGVALVIQNESESPLGEAGRGIGYDNMFGGLAIEFDTYQNGAFADPSGSHVAVQTNDGSRLRASHVAPFLKGITYDGIPNFVANGTHYHAKVEYDGSVLSVYVGENKNLDKPCLVIPINIAQEVGTSSDGRAWLGFTSATGFSSQQHILDYASLSSCNPVITSVPLLQPLHEATLLVQPNPATLTTTITLPKHASGMLLVYEVTGAVHTSKQVVDQDTITLPVSDLAPGAYAIRFVPDNGSPLHSMLFIGR